MTRTIKKIIENVNIIMMKNSVYNYTKASNKIILAGNFNYQTSNDKSGITGK